MYFMHFLNQITSRWLWIQYSAVQPGEFTFCLLLTCTCWICCDRLQHCSLLPETQFHSSCLFNNPCIFVMCEEYEELTAFLGFVYVWLMQESHIFQWVDKKIWPAALHQIFRVGGGHKGGHNDTVLRGFDEAILRGEVRNFWPSHISPFGAQGALKFFCVTLGMHRSRGGRFIPGEWTNWGSGHFLKHIQLNNIICAIFHTYMYWVNVGLPVCSVCSL